MAIQPLINHSIPRQLPRIMAATVSNGSKTTAQICNMAAPSLVPNFIKKSFDASIELLAKGIGKAAQNKKVQNFTKWFAGFDYTQHLSAVCANVLNCFYMYNVSKSKKIEEEQKGPLMLNMLIGTILSTLGGYKLNKSIDKKFISKIENAIAKEYSGKNVKTLMDGFKIAKSLMVFQLLYRFMCPVIATPIANHISNKIREKKEGEKGSLFA